MGMKEGYEAEYGMGMKEACGADVGMGMKGMGAEMERGDGRVSGRGGAWR